MRRRIGAVLFGVGAILRVEAAEPAPMIVMDGKPNAQIVIAAENRPRMVTLAALELQRGIEKISGARLAIVTVRDPNVPVALYVGRSPATDALGVSAQGLKHGAFRIISNPDSISLLGHDFDFVPPQPWARSVGGIPRAQEEWDTKVGDRTDSGWGLPWRTLYKKLWGRKDFDATLDAVYGAGSAGLWRTAGNSLAGFWRDDEGGSLNAVCHFLNGLGMRWYMPGPLGEVAPSRRSIPLPGTSAEVRADFAIRTWVYYNYSAFPFEGVMWSKRLGMNFGYESSGLILAHGLTHVYGHEAMHRKHPEYYALIGGKRDTEHRGYGTPCFSSEGLLKETIAFSRFLFNEYGQPATDIWPGDGLKVCQCERCKGKTASELVWGFADRVARELHKTHPDKAVLCGAYANYREAPDSIKQFSPNLQVVIANRGRPLFDDPERWAAYTDGLDRWRAVVAPGNIIRNENNRYHIYDEPKTNRVPFPIIAPHTMAKDLGYLRGISQGERGEMSQVGGDWKAPGLDHLTLYVQAKFLWDATQEVEPLLDEYFRLFYGPAAARMKAALTFAEQNYNRKDTSRSGGRSDPRNVPVKTSLRLRELLDAARAEAGETVYGERIAVLIAELQPREMVIANHEARVGRLQEARRKAPLALGVEGGEFDHAAEYVLKDDSTREPAAVKTAFRVAWQDDTLLLDIVCTEPDMAGLPARTTEGVWDGDHVAIALETPQHSFYKLEINPDGAVAEGNPTANRWQSLADIKIEKSADAWRLRIAIPVVSVAEADADPMHRVAGAKPTTEQPWYFNIGRVRIVNGGERQSFAGKGGWLSIERFGRLEIQ